jgi:GNAT superfamily N-acetyltransferase
MITIEKRVPTVDEFRSVAESVGWGDTFHWPTMAESLAGSLHSLVAVADGSAVATARLVGDGVRYFYVQDVMVNPDFSDQGIATTLMQRLIEWVEQHGAPKAFIGLFASPEAESVYADLGFSDDDQRGMYRFN